MKKTIDARGLSCPLPVIEAKKALREMSHGELEVIVDNVIALQNLEKMAQQEELKSSAETVRKGYHLFRIVVGEAPVASEPAAGKGVAAQTAGTIVVIASTAMGAGDRELGITLMKNFLYALSEQDQLPAKILLYNSGVKLAAQGSEAVQDLKKLAERGVDVLSCGICLDFYGLTDHLQVGSISNMYELTRLQLEASHLIRP